MFLLNVHTMQDACQKRLISSSDFIQSKRHEKPTLCDFLTRKYWINLYENACGSCLDIYLSGGERIYSWIYYFWIYWCLKSGFIAVVLTEVSSLKTGKKLLYSVT